MTYVGIDPSLTGTAIALIDTDGTAYTERLETKGGRGDTLALRAERIDRIVTWAHHTLDRIHVDGPVLIEAPAHGQTTGSHHDRSGLWWSLVQMITAAGHDCLEVTPQTLKKYATGKGNAGKDEVLISVTRRYPAFAGATNDEADAFVLAAIAAHLDGHPQAVLPQSHRDALNALSGQRCETAKEVTTP